MVGKEQVHFGVMSDAMTTARDTSETMLDGGEHHQVRHNVNYKTRWCPTFRE